MPSRQTLLNNTWYLQIEKRKIILSSLVLYGSSPNQLDEVVVDQKEIPPLDDYVNDFWILLSNYDILFVGSWNENNEKVTLSTFYINNMEELHYVGFSSKEEATWHVQNVTIYLARQVWFLIFCSEF